MFCLWFLGKEYNEMFVRIDATQARYVNSNFEKKNDLNMHTI